MPSDEVGLIVAVAGLGFWLAFIQTARHLPINLVSRMLVPLIVPIAVAAIWRIALEVRWWVLLVFISTSLVVGIVHGIGIRSAGKEGIYSLQPIMGTIGAGLVTASWFLR